VLNGILKVALERGVVEGSGAQSSSKRYATLLGAASSSALALLLSEPRA
jgi:hypothetical protein